MRLKNAITVVGDIDHCWLLAYRVPIAQLADVLPKPLEPVTLGGFGFINVVVSELSHMRPAGLPAFLGLRYWHVAYRIYAKVGGVEGLYFLRSDANNSAMVVLGNLLTDFQFHKAGVEVEVSQSRLALLVRSTEAPGAVRLDYSLATTLAEGSPFSGLEEAKEFLKYKPAGLSVHSGCVDVLRITRDEAAWRSKLVHVVDQEFAFLEPFGAVLEVCYEVEPIKYRWNRAERVVGG